MKVIKCKCETPAVYDVDGEPICQKCLTELLLTPSVFKGGCEVKTIEKRSPMLDDLLGVNNG